jgi:tetratricopeptide (TPR) repeat protein
VAAGHPVLVLQNLGLGFAPAWHYAVLVGYELDSGLAILRSGTTRREIMPLRTFEHTWARSGHWAFVAVKPGALPASALETEVAAATVALERSIAPAPAALAYQAALKRWPQNLTLAMGLGNARANAGDLAGAASAFEHAARQHDSAVAWNNLAHMRMKLGQHAAAVEAARRAVERAEAAEPQWLSITKATLATAQFLVR